MDTTREPQSKRRIAEPPKTHFKGKGKVAGKVVQKVKAFLPKPNLEAKSAAIKKERGARLIKEKAKQATRAGKDIPKPPTPPSHEPKFPPKPPSPPSHEPKFLPKPPLLPSQVRTEPAPAATTTVPMLTPQRTPTSTPTPLMAQTLIFTDGGITTRMVLWALGCFGVLWLVCSGSAPQHVQNLNTVRYAEQVFIFQMPHQTCLSFVLIMLGQALIMSCKCLSWFASHLGTQSPHAKPPSSSQ